MAHLKILGAGPVKRGITQIAAQFEKDTGHRISVEFAGAPSVRDRVLAKAEIPKWAKVIRDSGARAD